MAKQFEPNATYTGSDSVGPGFKEGESLYSSQSKWSLIFFLLETPIEVPCSNFSSE